MVRLSEGAVIRTAQKKDANDNIRGYKEYLSKHYKTLGTASIAPKLINYFFLFFSSRDPNEKNGFSDCLPKFFYGYLKLRNRNLP